MNRSTLSDLVVDTEGHCFLCWCNSATQQSLLNSADFIPYSIHSIQHLSRYLNINRRKMFHQEVFISKDLLVRVEKSNLKVPLCEVCAGLADQFSNQFIQLEKIQLEISLCLDAIHNRLGLTRTPMIGHPDGSASSVGLTNKLEIAKVLRAETLKKCSSKLSTIIPRVKLKKLTNQSVYMKRLLMTNISTPEMGLKSFSTSKHNEVVNYTTVKIEDTEFDGMGDNDGQGDDYLNESDVDSKATLFLPGSVAPSGEEIKVKSAKHWRPINSKNKKGKKFKSIQKRRRIKPQSVANPAPSISADLSGKLKERCSVNPRTGKLKCKICSKEFSKSKHLQVHYNSFHLHIKYKCDLCCGKEFLFKENWYRHRRLVHLEVKFKCEFCNMEYRQKTSLNKHRQSAHFVSKI